ncbi:hypothetical protein LOK49_LG09G01083 [Camellia lanceoleosa]|uniref:Uncharacterized protein n=1 Tax=Camellia lanceoleosa TaxID=1840588 RepID=A0ACC0GK40_9ERIC|nr:hypothetical protein LOK49_LG09G01083 [Camellia lanceoleosa]
MKTTLFITPTLYQTLHQNEISPNLSSDRRRRNEFTKTLLQTVGGGPGSTNRLPTRLSNRSTNKGFK